MPRAPKDLQQNSDGRWRMPVHHLKNGRKNAPYVYLGKMSEPVARRLVPHVKLAIQDSVDMADCQERAKYLAEAAENPVLLKARFRELASHERIIPVCMPEIARQEIRRFQSEITDEQLEEVLPDWITASANCNREEQVRLLVRLGDDPRWWAESFHLLDELSSGTMLNPDWMSQAKPKERRQAELERLGSLAKWAERAQQRRTVNDDTHKLSDCVKLWKERKTLEGLTDKHIGHYEKFFKAFIELVGDLPVNRLEKSTLTDWEAHLLRTKEKRGVRWIAESIKPICAILDFCRRKTDWRFPEALPGWFDCVDRGGKHKPAPHNARRMPVETFKAALTLVAKMASIDVQRYAESRPITATAPRTRKLQEANNLKQARRVKRAGVLWDAILRFAANTDADNSDICCLEWKHLHLDTPTPFVELPRSKTAEYRQIPLLPSTVQALKRWVEYEPQPAFTQCVFRNDGKRPLVSEKVWEGFDRIRKVLPENLRQHPDGNEWSFKHIRNIGTNVGKDHGIRVELREAFQGHTYKGMNLFYEEGFDYRAMVPLVSLIGETYLGGKHVGVAEGIPAIPPHSS